MQYVDVKVHENIATILLSRAVTCNALNPQLISDLMTALSDVHQEKRVRAVVLCGTGAHFCSGLDLTVLGEIALLPEAQAQSQWFTLWSDLTRLYEEILRFPKPVIAAVDGAAMGAGFALALAADCIVASTTASFAANAVHRGMVGGATAALLTFRVGAAVAARLLLTGQTIDAAEAYRLNLCGQPVPSEQVWVAAVELAKSTAGGPAQAVQAIKRQLNEDIGETLLTQLAAGAAASTTSCTTEATLQNLRAFLDRG